MFFFFVILFVIVVLATSAGIGLGYLLHWMLTIGLDSAIIAGAIFSYMAVSLTIKLITSLNKAESENDEIFILTENFGRVASPLHKGKEKNNKANIPC